MGSGLGFSIYKRKGSKKLQVQFRDNNGFAIQKSSGTTNRLEATRLAIEWKEKGLPQENGKPPRPVAEQIAAEALIYSVSTAKLTEDDAKRIVDILSARGLVEVHAGPKPATDQPLVAYLRHFWDYDHSPYVHEKIAHGQRISRRHCLESSNRIAYWEKDYAALSIGNLSQQEISALSLKLSAQGLSPATINKVMLVCSTAMAWAKRHGVLERDPFEGTMRFSERHKKRGILAPEEVTALFAKGRWPNSLTRVASLLSCTTGLRAGECRAVQIQDIHNGYLTVWAWSDIDGRKPPKNGENRVVPLLPQVVEELNRLVAENPFGQSPENFVFYSAFPERPIRPEPLIKGLEAALESIGIDNNTRLERHIDFHSWRHYYAATMATYVTSRKLRVVTGHKSQSVFDGYADHAQAADVQEVKNAERAAFRHIFDAEMDMETSLEVCS